MTEHTEDPWHKETLVNLGISELKRRERLHDIIWDKILWPWQQAYVTDRHVSPLFDRSDVVLHRLADLIATQLEEARRDGELRAQLTDDQFERLRVWRNQQDEKVFAAQKAQGSTNSGPDYGAIGGALTFESTATSIGVVQKVIFCKGTEFEAELDLTDFSGW